MTPIQVLRQAETTLIAKWPFDKTEQNLQSDYWLMTILTQNDNFFTHNNFEQILMLWISLVFPKGHMRGIVLVQLRTQICESS